jgi:hypothetical protein
MGPIPASLPTQPASPASAAPDIPAPAGPAGAAGLAATASTGAGPASAAASIFVDAVHDQLDGQTPHGSTRASLTKLNALIEQKLQPVAPRTDGSFATSFRNINPVGDGNFAIRLDNGQSVTRSLEETRLHILLESQLRQCAPPAAGNDAAISMVELARHDFDAASRKRETSAPGKRAAPAPAMPAPASPLATPSTPEANFWNSTLDTQVFPCSDISGNHNRIFNRACMDVTEACARLTSTSHRLKTVSGFRNDCWWRASMISAILQADPATLEATIVQKLGTSHASDAAQLRRMAQAARDHGLQAVVTKVGSAATGVDIGESLLKLPGGTDQHGTAGEEICRRVVGGLLAHANVDQSEIDSTVTGTHLGQLQFIPVLLSQLGCDAVIMHQPSALADKDQPVGTDQPNIAVEICAQPGSPLHDFPLYVDRVEFTDKFVEAAQHVPCLSFGAAHLNLYIPNEFIR